MFSAEVLARRKKVQDNMGLSHFPSISEGVLPVLVMNTVLSVSLLKNMVRSMLSAMGSTESASINIEENLDDYPEEFPRERRISVTQFKSLRNTGSTADAMNNSNRSTTATGAGGWVSTVECCVCLCLFEAEEEVSELSCRHFFHKDCLEKWFHNKHSTCPLCRSIE